MCHGLHKNIKHTTVFIIFYFYYNKKCVLGTNQNIRMISEGSCDTKTGVTAADNSVCHHRNILHFTVFTV